MSGPYRPAGHRAAEIAADVEAAVAAGRATAGQLLPPVRSLAAELGVAAGTVATAYRLLTERGVVEGNRRAGTRIRPRPGGAPRRPGAVSVPPGTTDLATGNPDPALLPDLRAALRGVSSARRVYGAPTVLPALATFAEAAFAADHIQLPAVTITGGALDAIERALQVHLRPGMRVAVEDPGYAGLLDLVGALGLVAEPVAVDDVGMQPDGLAAALAHGAQAVVITPRAQNPTGAALTPARAAELREVLVAHRDVLVVEDDHAGPVSGAPTATVVGGGEMGGEQPVVVVRSSSKALGPDLRLAVVAGDGATIAAMEARQAVGVGWVSHLLQEVVLALLSDPAVAADLERVALTYGARRRSMLAALGARGIAAAGMSGLNVWVPVGDEASVIAGMAARGWAIAGGARYRVASPPGVRVTVAALDDPDDVVAVADDLAASIAGGRLGRAG